MTWQRLPRIHDAAHDKARREWAVRHDPAAHCTRENDPRVNCPGGPLGPVGSHLELDHHDYDKTRYLGFAHRKCNRDAGAARGRATQKARAAARKGLTQPATRLRW
jgi:hypothetical protein